MSQVGGCENDIINIKDDIDSLIIMVENEKGGVQPITDETKLREINNKQLYEA